MCGWCASVWELERVGDAGGDGWGSGVDCDVSESGVTAIQLLEALELNEHQCEIIEHQEHLKAQQLTAEGLPWVRLLSGTLVNQIGNWPALWDPENGLWGVMDAEDIVQVAQTKARSVAQQ
jgi:hypothetical protein